MNANCIISLSRLSDSVFLSARNAAEKVNECMRRLGFIEGSRDETFSRLCFRETKENILMHTHTTRLRLETSLNWLLMNFQFIPSPSSPNWVILQQSFLFVFVFVASIAWRPFFVREFFSFVFVYVAFVHETNKRYHPNGKLSRRLLFRGLFVTVLHWRGFINLAGFEADTE